MSQQYTDQELIALLKKDNEKVIDILFRSHYTYLCQTAYRIIPDTNFVEDLVQDVFYELWRKRKTIEIKSAVRAYLKRAVINRSLNYIRGQRMKYDDSEKHRNIKSKQPTTQQQLEADEIQIIINNAIDSLPEKCRQVFVLSRFEAMSYKQIADHLNISTKTVENQISKALKHIRKTIKPYLTG